MDKSVLMSRLLPAILVLGFCLLFTNRAAAQTGTPAGTVITNQATAVFSDGLQIFTSSSNIVSLTVAEVSGITITPDGGTNPPVVLQQTTADFIFTVSNTGNGNNQIRFPANGASFSITGPAAAAAAVIDTDNNGTISQTGDTDILTNGADIISQSVAQNGSFKVIVRVNISSGAAAGQNITVTLGDAGSGGPTYDNQAANSSGHEVRTVSQTSVNGLREARGDISAAVTSGSQLLLTLSAPAGPILLGDNITYTVSANNPGNYKVTPVVLTNAASSVNTRIFIIAPVPVQTRLTSQSFPAGTLFTASPLSIDPLQAVYSATPPSDLSTVTRIAFNGGANLNTGAATSVFSFQVKVPSNANSSNPVPEIADVFGQNTLGLTITDQSGDSAPNAGDGNADFNEGNQPGSVDGSGIIQTTALSGSGLIMNGPAAKPMATGPNNSNDDSTNLSTRLGINVAPSGATTQADSVIFVNTVANFSLLADTFILTAPAVPSGFKVEISTSAGLFWTDVTNGGSASILVLLNLTGNYLVRITAPAGTPVLAGYDTVIRASLIGAPAIYNDTINRLYTGYVRLDKTFTVNNETGFGRPNDAVTGAVITFKVTYTNISSTGGTDNAILTASTITITEDGSAGTNNWGTKTNMVLGSAADTHPGGLPAIITGDLANSTVLVDTVLSMTLGPGQRGAFTYKRMVK